MDFLRIWAPSRISTTPIAPERTGRIEASSALNRPPENLHGLRRPHNGRKNGAFELFP